MSSVPKHTSNKLKELALLFFRLGVTAFGGPPAHIAMMHDEVVTRRKWLGEQQFHAVLPCDQVNISFSSLTLNLALRSVWHDNLRRDTFLRH